MSTTIHGATTSVTPDLVLELRWTREARTIVHQLLSRQDPDVTIRPTGLRSGDLACYVEDRATADTLAALAASGEVLTITSDDDDLLDGLALVVAGDIVVELDTQTLTRSLVTVPYREVLP